MAYDTGGFELEDSLGQCQIGSIQKVKSLDPGLKVQFFPYREFPRQGCVDCGEARTTQDVETGVAVLKGRRSLKGSILAIDGGIEPVHY